MIPISAEELKDYDYSTLLIKMPDHLLDNLIGEKIEGTEFYKTLSGDPTPAGGYYLLENGEKIYKVTHQPTGSELRYRKINSLAYGDVWEVIPREG